MDRVAATYRDFGPTLAAEKLQERDGLAVSRKGSGNLFCPSNEPYPCSLLKPV
jgi:hypothetical protein